MHRHHRPAPIVVVPLVLVVFLVQIAMAPDAQARPFLRGDANADGQGDISDAVFTLGWLFSGGDEPACQDAADMNDSGRIDLSDPVFLLGHLFQGGAPLPPPSDACGDDPTADAIGCRAYEACDDGPTPTTVQDTLDALAVDTSFEERVEASGEALPEDFAPLGSRVSLAHTNELFLVGMNRPGTSSRFDLVGFELRGNVPAVERLGRADLIAPEWAPGARVTVFARERGATAADVDGDGHDELCVAYVDPRGTGILLDVVDDTVRSSSNAAQARGAVETYTLAAGGSWSDVTIVGGDFDGDGIDELALGHSAAGAGASVLSIFDDAACGFVRVGTAIPLGPAAGDETWVELAVGNIDFDRHEEIAVVRGAYFRSPFPGRGECSYVVLDDGARGFAPLATDVVAHDPEADEYAQAADIALGDIDGDGLDEVVIGGLLEFTYDECRPIAHMAQVLDDAAHGLEELGRRRFFDNWWRETCINDASSPNLTRFVHVNTVDLSGEGADEIQMNQIVFGDWREGPNWEVAYEIPDEKLGPDNGFDRNVTYGRSTSSIVAADVIGLGGDPTLAAADGSREQLVLFAQWTGEVSVWGVDALTQNGWSELATIATQPDNRDTAVHPIVVPADVEPDGPVLRYSEASYEFVFSEPLVIAALAAAPCQFGIGQNVDDCNTVYGTETSDTVATDQVISTTVASSWGAEIPIVDDVLNIGVQQELETTTAELTGSAYELSRSISYTTGGAEDAVVFMTVPLDLYTYTIVSHPDDESLEGTTVTVGLPRDPIETIVTLETYNASMRDPELRVDVFEHAPGDICSYPTRNSLLRLGSRLTSQVGSVGQGGGSVSVGIRFAEQSQEAEGLAVDFTTSVETNGGGVIGGVSVGAGREKTVTITHGEATTYEGVVGSIADADEWAAWQYDFGLVVHTHREPGRQFEVLEYWVDAARACD